MARAFSLQKSFVVAGLVTLSLALIPVSSLYAKAGCCSKHGGVAGCDTSSGFQLCKDGTKSPSCACDGSSRKAAPVNKTTKTTTAPKTNTRHGHMNTTTTTEPAPVATPAPATKTTGCCSRHGGVLKCDTKTGFQICKDGTHSSTCKCAKVDKRK